VRAAEPGARGRRREPSRAAWPGGPDILSLKKKQAADLTFNTPAGVASRRHQAIETARVTDRARPDCVASRQNDRPPSTGEKQQSSPVVAASYRCVGSESPSVEEWCPGVRRPSMDHSGSAPGVCHKPTIMLMHAPSHTELSATVRAPISRFTPYRAFLAGNIARTRRSAIERLWRRACSHRNIGAPRISDIEALQGSTHVNRDRSLRRCRAGSGREARCHD
jgi:hypothetical protein